MATAGHRRDSVVLGAAVGLVGITFGVLASAAGLSVAKAMAMSLLVFTGASQFAAVGVIGNGGSPISAVGGALLLAARNGLYGMRLSERLERYGWRRYPGAQLVIDESTAMSIGQQDEQAATEAFWWTGFAIYFFWNVGTLIGVSVGDLLGDPNVWGLDAAFPASFVALIGPHISHKTRPRRSRRRGGDCDRRRAVYACWSSRSARGSGDHPCADGRPQDWHRHFSGRHSNEPTTMSWAAIVVLAAGAYLFKLCGVLVGNRVQSRVLTDAISLIPAALFAAVIALQTIAVDTELVADARLVGVGVAVVATWRKVPFVGVIVLAMAATALVRVLG